MYQHQSLAMEIDGVSVTGNRRVSALDPGFASVVSRLTAPALVIRRDLSLAAMNGPALDLLQDAEWICEIGGRLALHDGVDAWRLRQCVTRLADTTAPDDDALALQPAAAAGRIVHLWITPLGGTGELAASKGYFLLLVIDRGRPLHAPAAILQTVYGLTDAECRLADAMLNGATVERYARHNHVSTNTVRSHLKSIYRKTDTNRQSDLIGTLTRLLTDANTVLQQPWAMSDASIQTRYAWASDRLQVV